MTTTRRAVVNGISAAALAAPAALSSRSARAQASSIVIAGSVPLTGGQAGTGRFFNNGYKLAVDRINQMGGVDVGGKKYTFDLKLFDDASDPARARTLIQRQVDDGVRLFLGSYGSNIVLPTVAVVERAGGVMVQAGGGADAIYTQGYKSVFNINPRASLQFISIAKYFGSLTPKIKTLTVITANNSFSKAYSEGAIAACKAAGIDLLEHHQLPEQVTDSSSVLTAIRGNQPDLLLVNVNEQNSMLIARQMIASGTNAKLLEYFALGPQLSDYRKALGRYANGMTCGINWDQNNSFQDKYFGPASNFLDAHRKAFGDDFSWEAAIAATCIIVYAEALTRAGSLDPLALRETLREISIPETLYGAVKFTKDGDGDPNVMGTKVFQVQNGEIAVLIPEDKVKAKINYPIVPWRERS